MISAIIIVGISLKLAVILVLIRTSIGFSTMYQRLKQSISFTQNHSEVNSLAAGLIQEFEDRTALFTSESVEETTLLEESEKPAASPKKSEGFFSLMKQKIDSKASDRRARKSPAMGRPSEANQPWSLVRPASLGQQACSPVDVVSKTCPSEDVPTAPVSLHPALFSSLLMQHAAGLAGARRAARSDVQRVPQLTLIPDHSKKPAKGSSRIRSRLAVKLEKKLESLDARVSLASTLPRQEVLLHKLDKLARNHSKKQAQMGRTELPVVFEDERALSN
jgi:hypothetical protein